jgi:hypothetical protein
MRAYRQGQQPFSTAVRPTGGGAQIFLEEWERGAGKAGGLYAGLGGLYTLTPRWNHRMPAGDSGAIAAPAVSSHQQMLWLALNPQLEADTVEYRWNAAIARLPTMAAEYSIQIDACYHVGIDTTQFIDPPPVEQKPASLGIILGSDALLSPAWPAEFWFSASESAAGEVETSPEVWTNAQTLDSVSAAEGEGNGVVYLTALVTRSGGSTSIISFCSSDGVSKVQVGTQEIVPNPTCIGFAVRTQRPAPDDLGHPASGWCEYIRVRPAAAGGLGSVNFGQTGGRNW